jgi:glycosyltransferase involved in cell wall biosynthesis
VRSGLPPEWRLLVAGRDDGTGALKAQAAARGIADHVIWAGERRDTGNVYAAADLFILPSHEEGLSNSLLEAMAYGLPAIATALGGNLDAIVPGETGVLVPAKAPEALGQAIADLAADAGLRARMGAAARARAEQQFSVDACVRRYVSLYRGAARRGGEPVQALIEPMPSKTDSM